MSERIPEGANAWALSSGPVGAGADVMVDGDRVAEARGATAITVGRALNSVTREGAKVWLWLTPMGGLPAFTAKLLQSATPTVVELWRGRGLGEGEVR